MSPTRYQDIKLVLDTVLERGVYPAEYELDTRGAAVNWRQRANTYLSRLRKEDAELHGKPHGESSYDNLIFGLDGATVIIRLREPTGTLKIGGEEVTPTPITDDLAEDDFELGGDLE